MYENYYHEQLTKISTCVKYLTDAFHKYTLMRHILLFYFRNINSHDYYRDSINVMFPRFPPCFLPFPLVFLHVSPGVCMVSLGVSSVSPVSPLFPILNFVALFYPINSSGHFTLLPTRIMLKKYLSTLSFPIKQCLLFVKRSIMSPAIMNFGLNIKFEIMFIFAFF